MIARQEIVAFRVSQEDKELFQRIAEQMSYRSTGDFLHKVTVEVARELAQRIEKEERNTPTLAVS